jgi:hypothetical protein
MIKAEHKVIFLSILAGLSVGVIDTLMDYFIFSKGSFWDMLIFDVPTLGLYMRTIYLVGFILFGFAISRFISTPKQK